VISGNSNISLRVYAKPQQIQRTLFGLDVNEIAMRMFTNAFKIQYSIDKLDQVVLPSSSSLAMSNDDAVNYGIAFYHENRFLYTRNVSKYEIY
jgi:aminopeptidase N